MLLIDAMHEVSNLAMPWDGFNGSRISAQKRD
jgi:hypothetical protein